MSPQLFVKIPHVNLDDLAKELSSGRVQLRRDQKPVSWPWIWSATFIGTEVPYSRLYDSVCNFCHILSTVVKPSSHATKKHNGASRLLKITLVGPVKVKSCTNPDSSMEVQHRDYSTLLDINNGFVPLIKDDKSTPVEKDDSNSYQRFKLFLPLVPGDSPVEDSIKPKGRYDDYFAQLTQLESPDHPTDVSMLPQSIRSRLDIPGIPESLLSSQISIGKNVHIRHASVSRLHRREYQTHKCHARHAFRQLTPQPDSGTLTGSRVQSCRSSARNRKVVNKTLACIPQRPRASSCSM